MEFKNNSIPRKPMGRSLHLLGTASKSPIRGEVSFLERKRILDEAKQGFTTEVIAGRVNSRPNRVACVIAQEIDASERLVARMKTELPGIVAAAVRDIELATRRDSYQESEVA